MSKVYRLCIYDLPVVAVALGTLYALGLGLSIELLVWLFGLTMPVILALHVGRRVVRVFTMASFIIAALVALVVHRFKVLVVLDGIFLFVGSYVYVSVKLRIPISPSSSPPDEE